MNNCDIHSITEITRNIFQGARIHSAETFQDWALDRIKALIAFDSCKWVTGVIINEQATMHSCHFHNLPYCNHHDYEPYLAKDRILNKLIENRKHTCTFDRYEVISREEFIKSDIYRKYCCKYKIEHLLSSIVPELPSHLFSVISLGRNDYEQPFSPTDKQIKTILAPVLTQAKNHNIFINLLKAHHDSRLPAAICDSKGILREVQPKFSKLMDKEWPGWQGPTINEIPEELLRNQEDVSFKGKKICIRISPFHDLVLLQAQVISVLDKLSHAEKNVADQLLNGLSDKEIARQLNISSKTVGHHLQNIYQKTAFSNRAQMISQLKNKV